MTQSTDRSHGAGRRDEPVRGNLHDMRIDKDTGLPVSIPPGDATENRSGRFDPEGRLRIDPESRIPRPVPPDLAWHDSIDDVVFAGRTALVFQAVDPRGLIGAELQAYALPAVTVVGQKECAVCLQRPANFGPHLGSRFGELPLEVPDHGFFQV